MTMKNDDIMWGISNLINLRLSYMQDIAVYKMQQGENIMDQKQELRVLKNTLIMAEYTGLNTETVEPFVQALMDMAKAIQHRYHADWLLGGDLPTIPTSLTEVRKQVAQSGNEILVGITQQLKISGGFSIQDKTLFCQYVQHEKMTERDKKWLWQWIAKIKLHDPLI